MIRSRQILRMSPKSVFRKQCRRRNENDESGECDDDSTVPLEVCESDNSTIEHSISWNQFADDRQTTADPQSQKQLNEESPHDDDASGIADALERLCRIERALDEEESWSWDDPTDHSSASQDHSSLSWWVDEDDDDTRIDRILVVLTDDINHCATTIHPAFHCDDEVSEISDV